MIKILFKVLKYTDQIVVGKDFFQLLKLSRGSCMTQKTKEGFKSFICSVVNNLIRYIRSAGAVETTLSSFYVNIYSSM